jgi:hypothetical protein
VPGRSWDEEARKQGLSEQVTAIMATAVWDAAEQLDRQLGAELS